MLKVWEIKFKAVVIVSSQFNVDKPVSLVRKHRLMKTTLIASLMVMLFELSSCQGRGESKFPTVVSEDLRARFTFTQEESNFVVDSISDNTRDLRVIYVLKGSDSLRHARLYYNKRAMLSCDSFVADSFIDLETQRVAELDIDCFNSAVVKKKVWDEQLFVEIACPRSTWYYACINDYYVRIRLYSSYSSRGDSIPFLYEAM